jgi:LPXTG-motif cell wall-anchored protein
MNSTVHIGYANTSLVFFLFGIFCAYWAQTTGRNVWLWFLAGALFALIAGLVLLFKNRRRE